jgi:hypothetical protein
MTDTAAKDILNGEGWSRLSSARGIMTETGDRTAREMTIGRNGAAAQSPGGGGKGDMATSGAMRIIAQRGLTITTAPGKMMAVDGIIGGATDPETVTHRKKNMDAIEKDVAERLDLPNRVARREGDPDPDLDLAIGQITERIKTETIGRESPN